MSRIGRMPVELPPGVEVRLEEGNYLHVKGPRGELGRQLPREMRVEVDEGELRVARPSEARKHKALHGLTRSLAANMVIGVTQGFEKRLEMVGVGYRAALQGNKLGLQLGFSHPVEIDPPPGIEIDVPAPNRITVRGIDKELVGEVAAKIRSLRQAEPYKGKGVRYEGEYVRRKVGKAGA